jgi:Carboxypeptidase regulatory-like domain
MIQYQTLRQGCLQIVSYLSLSLFISCFWLNLGTARLAAQATSSATIAGVVTDQQGATIPGVEITLTDSSTSAVQTKKTNDVGRYVFANVAPSTYTVVFGKVGFSTYKLEAQTVEIGTTLTLDASLQVGATSTTVEVQARAAAELQTTSASVGTTLSSNDIQSLPNLGRDVATLAVLQPGVTLGGYTAGAVQDQNSYTVDGGNNSDDMAGNNTSYVTNFTGVGGVQQGGSSSGVVPTPVESIEEFKVTTFNQTADFNGGLGSQVQMMTKRGTNQIHGAGYGYYFATNVGAANFWDKNHTPSGSLGYTPLPSNHRDRFGGAIGGPIFPKFLGGKWFAFFNYEGLRFPNVNTYERAVPSDLMRMGIIQVANASGGTTAFNLNPTAVTVNGVTYAPAQCGNAACDPRGIGLNPVVAGIWAKMPHGNDPLYGGTGADGLNVIGYQSPYRTPLTTNAYVGRIDHDFSDKWHFMSSYRYMRLINLTNNQVDIGGALPGDTLGQPTAVAPRDQVPSLLVGGLTTVLSPTATNSFVYSYTRNFWQWGSVNAPPQLTGLGGAVEIAPGNTSTAESIAALIPYNVNTQNVRQRFWDGQDNMFKDDVTMIKGSHIIQVGGVYQRNFDFHMRTDNGNGVNNAIVYQVGANNTSFTGLTYPNALIGSNGSVSSASQTQFQNLYSEVLGFVSQPQVTYTRTGSNLTIQPIGSVAYERSVIPSYNLYASDSWHIKPTLTLTYGLSWALEMPPYELNGSQVMLVDANGKPVSSDSYLANRQSYALLGKAYNPTLGFETIKGVGRKYPFDPVYTDFGPRIALAWSPKYSDGMLGKVLGDNKTVLRAGYGRIFGRLNGVNLVLVPLLGPGLLQAVSCQGPASNGTCAGSGKVTPSTVFRIGTDGNVAPLAAPTTTLPQPFYPGVNGAYAQDPSSIDPNYKPERTDNFTVSIQRAIGSKSTLEVGYIGRIIKNEGLNLNLDAVPYMTTLNGQSFAQAYAATFFALQGTNFTSGANVPAQPFFEAALGGANSAYCKGAASCTAKLASGNLAAFQNTRVSNIWQTMNAAPSWTLGSTQLDVNQMSSISMIDSVGYGNYNAMFVTFRSRDFHGISSTSNFTWGRSLGTAAVTQASSAYTALDVFNIGANYGPQSYDIKFIYNFSAAYQIPFYKSQKGVLGHILGGWTISPIFFAQSGAPIAVGYNEGGICSSACQAFGESSSSGISTYAENAVLTSPFTGGSSSNSNVTGSNGIGTVNPTGVNLFSNPAAVYAEFRKCVLGYDTSCGGYGNLRGQPTWNLDATVLKTVGIWKEGRVGATLNIQVTNVLNHDQLGTSAYGANSLTLSSPTLFGRLTTQANTPRNMEFGLRVFF